MLNENSIKQALINLKPGLIKYYEIQKSFKDTNTQTDLSFQKKFNGFYRVRRNKQWRKIFFELMENSKNTQDLKFEDILKYIFDKTNRIEASFSSKLIATIDDSMPVLDSFVLSNVDLKLPTYSSKNRIENTIVIYNKLFEKMNDKRNSNEGQIMISKFKETYPTYDISEMKMIDLILWQIRD